MAISYNNTTLEKIEDIFLQLGYRVRSEKGNFRTGACILQDSKVVVVNKFANLESKINSLLQLLLSMTIDDSVLNEKSKNYYHSLLQTKLVL